MVWAVRRAKGVRIDPGTWILVACSLAAAAVAVVVRLALPPSASLPLGIGVSLVVGLTCLRVLVRRLGGTPALLDASRVLALLGRMVRRSRG